MSDRERPLVTGVNGPLMARQPRSASLGVLARMPVAQLDPVHETGARLFKRDRSCWKSGLRSARFTNADCRRPSAPPRKMAADPVQHSDQPVTVPMSAFLRHISIMHLLSLGYEHHDVCLCRLAWSRLTVDHAGLAEPVARFHVEPTASPPFQAVPPRLVHKAVHSSGSWPAGFPAILADTNAGARFSRSLACDRVDR